MRYRNLREKISFNLFTLADVIKFFPYEKDSLIRTQLSRFTKKKLIVKIKRGLYCFSPDRVDGLELANKLYSPSYISLETALNYHGLIPDIPQSITSINLTTTKKIVNRFGVFYYTKINARLFFGFTKVKSSQSPSFINIASKEKALLDYLYLRKITAIDELRLNFDQISSSLLKKFIKFYPPWVRKIVFPI